MDGILIMTNDKGLLYEVKQFISKNFDMKDMGDASSLALRSIEIDFKEFWFCLKKPISIRF